MSPESYDRNFRELYKLFNRTFAVYFTWKGLQEKEFEIIYHKDNSFWWVVLFSLEQTWLSGIANVFENSRYSEDGSVISVYSLYPHQADVERQKKVKDILDGHGELLKNVRILRHHQLAHNNVEYLLNPQSIHSKFPIGYTDIDHLFELAGEIMSNLYPAPGHGFAYLVLRDQAVSGSHDIIRKLKYYLKKDEEHLSKFKRGKVDDPFLPE